MPLKTTCLKAFCRQRHIISVIMRSLNANECIQKAVLHLRETTECSSKCDECSLNAVPNLFHKYPVSIFNPLKTLELPLNGYTHQTDCPLPYISCHKICTARKYFTYRIQVPDSSYSPQVNFRLNTCKTVKADIVLTEVCRQCP